MALQETSSGFRKQQAVSTLTSDAQVFSNGQNLIDRTGWTLANEAVRYTSDEPVCKGA